MNTLSHIFIGRFLCRYAEKHYKIRLERGSFVLGNILPDFCPSFLTRPHYLKNSAGYVQKTIRLLVSQPPSAYDDKKRSRLLGVLCHFYADFFCYVHGEHFTGGMPEHIEYESRLHRYLIENRELIGTVRFIAQPMPGIGAEGIYRQFEKLHSGYLRSRPSFGNDLLYALTACVDLIVLISGQAAGEREPGDFHYLQAV